MAHEAAHPAVAVGERVDKVQPVMGAAVAMMRPALPIVAKR